MVRELIRMLRLLIALPLVLTMLGASGAVWADPPARAGRLSVIDGELALRRDGSQQWESASVNLPLTSGDELATESDSRAEIRIGSSVLRLDENTSLEILRLDDERIRVRLVEGSVAVRVRSPDPDAAIEVETRNGLAVPTEPGQYRVDHSDSATFVSNYRGHIDFRTDDRQVSVTDGRRAQILADGRSTEVRWDSPDDDDFSEWSLARDERDDRLARKGYVSPEMTGAEDLYEHGDWREYDDYGPVWFPRSMPYGWAPYRYGHWVWVVPWGWTWVDDAPWGFAPFHYGRWVLISGSWAWVPGRYISRPVFAPALVAWVGTPGVSISFTAGRFPADVSWFPLAPREVYVPRYRHSTTYVRQVNITHVTNITEINRVVREPQRVRHVFRDRHDAVTRVSEKIVRQPRPVTVDVERRRERLAAQWERRGWRPRDERRLEGVRQQDRTQQQRGTEPVLAPPQGEREVREESRRQTARERIEQEQQERKLQRESRQEQRQELQQERKQERQEQQQERKQERQDRIEAQRQQQMREREEQARQQATQAQEQERRRQAVREEAEQQREKQRAQAEQRQQERQQERQQRQQQIREREEQASQQDAARAQEQERRRQATRQQIEQAREQARQNQRLEAESRQREREAQQQQVQQRQAERAREREAPQQQIQQRQAERVQQRDAQQGRRDGGEEEDQRAKRRRPPPAQGEEGRPIN